MDKPHGGIAGSSSDIGSDAAGNIFAVGSTRQTTDGIMRAVVLGSGDQGATWQVLDQYAEPGLNYSHNRAVAADRFNGKLFAGGNLNNLLPNGTYEFDTLWFIREWNPDTSVWATVDDYSDLANDVGQASCADILVTPSGDVYATGGSALGAGPGFLLRKRPAGASVFTTVDADYSRQTAGAGWDLGFHPSYGVFAVVEDAAGNLIVCGQIAGAAGDLHWIVRKGTPGTKLVKQGGKWVTIATMTWATSDDFQLVPGKVASPNAITTDSNGNIYVSGHAQDANGVNHWIVRKLTP